MVFNWSTENLCIIFPSWRITSTLSLLLSLLAIVLLSAGYEAVRDLAQRYDAATAPFSKLSDDEARNGGIPPALIPSRRGGRKSVKAALYAVQVFYSFFIMLLFMTYNGFVMGAVTLGAFVGFMVFGKEGAGSSKSVACH
ncbi:MAG: hypothetical protein Q9159_000021 [Coniocarpon cinnabarinum]